MDHPGIWYRYTRTNLIAALTLVDIPLNLYVKIPKMPTQDQIRKVNVSSLTITKLAEPTLGGREEEEELL